MKALTLAAAVALPALAGGGIARAQVVRDTAQVQQSSAQEQEQQRTVYRAEWHGFVCFPVGETEVTPSYMNNALFISRMDSLIASHHARRAKAAVEETPSEVEVVENPKREKKPKAEKPTTPDYDKEPLFVSFWNIYPRKKNVSKKDAFRFFLKLTDAEKQTLNDSAAKFAEEMNGKDERYIPHPSTYIDGRRWETANDTNTSAEPKRTAKVKFFD